MKVLLLPLIATALAATTSALTSIHHSDEAILVVEGVDDAEGPSNCLPFGSSDWGLYKGFIYANIPAFSLAMNDRLGALERTKSVRPDNH